MLFGVSKLTCDIFEILLRLAQVDIFELLKHVVFLELIKAFFNQWVVQIVL